MTTSKKIDFLESKLEIQPGTNFLMSFYDTFDLNIIIFTNSRPDIFSVDQSNKKVLNEILKPVFGTTLNSSDYITLENKTDINLKTNLFYYLSNVSDDTLCNILTIGTISSSVPTEIQKKQFSSAATSVFQPLHDNYATSMRYVRSNQFGCTIGYTGYAYDKKMELNFLTNIDPSSIGFCLGLASFIDNNKINYNDAQILSNLIKCYCNIATKISDNQNVINNQMAANNYFTTFENSYLESVRKFAIEDLPNSSNRTGVSNAPTASIIRPIILPYSGNSYDSNDENFGNATIEIKNSDSLLSPSAQGIGPNGIVLNTFTQSNFSDILSILDVIRNTDDATQIQEIGPPITVNGGDSGDSLGEELKQPNQTVGFFKDVIKKFQPEEKNSAKQAIQDKIKELENEVDNLVIQRNSIMKSNEFIATSIVATFGTVNDTHPVSKPDSSSRIDVLRNYYFKMSQAIQNESVEAGTSSSIYVKIKAANSKTVQDWDKQFLKNLEITNDTYTPISKDTIDRVNAFASNPINKYNPPNPPAQFFSVVSIVNKANSQKNTKNIQKICQDIVNKVRSTEVKKIAIEKQLAKIRKDYDDLLKS